MMAVVFAAIGMGPLHAAPVPMLSRGTLDAGGGSQSGGAWRNLGAIGGMGGATARAAGVANFSGYWYTLPPLADGDADGDGLLDAWDPDNDPLVTTAGLALDAGSVRLKRSLAAPSIFHITSMQYTPLGVRLTWDAEPYRTYRVLRLDRAGGGLAQAQPVTTVTVGADGAGATAEGVAFDGEGTQDAAAFYRVEWVP